MSVNLVNFVLGPKAPSVDKFNTNSTKTLIITIFLVMTVQKRFTRKRPPAAVAGIFRQLVLRVSSTRGGHVPGPDCNRNI